MKRRLLLPLLSLLAMAVLVSGSAAAADYSPKIQKPEWRYIDEDDDAAAEKLLEKLLKQYGTERKAASLVKLLRKGRLYLGGLDQNKTINAPCDDGMSRQFTWHLPSRYTPKKKHGVLVFLHGAISQPAPGGGHHESESIGKAVDSLGFIKVGPSTYDRHEWGEAALRRHVHRALDQVKQRFNVDENRVYIAGDSDGGRGAYAIVETEATFFAAAIPTIGSPGGVTRFLNLRNLPFLAINGAKDELFKIDGVTQAVESMKKTGIAVDFKVIEDAGHDPFLLVKQKETVCDFIGKHPRDPLPKVVEWHLDPEKTGYEQGFPADTFRWIRIDQAGAAASNAAFDDSGTLIRGNFPRVRAEKLAGNAVKVETKGVKRVTILVSDEMFDLELPIEVDVNGRRLFAGKVVPDARAIFTEARRFNDRCLIFSNRITIDVDGEPVVQTGEDSDEPEPGDEKR
jgi:homoserine acetyltransferase